MSIPHRFRGPASSGNGGWTAGSLASYLAPGPVRVTLRKPPPLDTELDVTIDDETATATRDDVVIAAAMPADEAVSPVEHLEADRARAAEAAFAGHSFHPFPTCFSCGTGREPNDGLRIFPGRVDDDSEGRVRVASTWTPDRSLGGETASLPVTWAALDCVGGWAGDLTQRLMVLGSMTAHVLDLPRIGKEHVLVGGARGSAGRRTFTASTLYDADGRALASAEHVWVAVDPEDFS